MFKSTLRQKTDKALGALSATLAQLAGISSEAEAAHAKNQGEIEKLQAENADLTALIAENTIVQTNIKTLLGK